MNKKKICFIFVVFIIIVTGCIFLREIIFGKSEHLEGDNVEIITNRFVSFSNISKCFYKIDIVSGGIGPTTYTMRALVIIDEQETKYLLDQYEWKRDQSVVVDKDLYQGVEIETIENWLYSNKFTSDTLGSFIGEVYFSEEENCIYINAAR